MKQFLTSVFCLWALFLSGQNIFFEPVIEFAFADFATQPFSASLADRYQMANDDITEKIQIGELGMGSGFAYGGAVGLRMTDFLFLKMKVTYQLASSEDYTSIYQTAGGDDSYNFKYTTKLLSISPALQLQPALETPIKPYMSIGLIAGVPEVEREFLFTGANGETESEILVYASGFSVGYSTNLGLSFETSESFSFWGEFGLNHLQVKPNISQVFEYKINGNDVTDTLTDHQKFTDYLDEVDRVYAPVAGGGVEEVIDETIPAQAPKFVMGLSSVRINVGVRYFIGRK